MEENSIDQKSSFKNPLSNRIPWYYTCMVIILLLVSLILLGYNFNKIYSKFKQTSVVPQDFEAYVDHIQSAKTFWGMGDNQRVIQEGGMALNISTTNEQKSGAHYWIGIGYYRLGNLDVAQQHEESAISLDSEFSGPYVTLGAIMLDKGDIPKAKELALKSVDMDNGYSWAHNLLGLVLNAEGQKEQAILEIKKAIKLEPLNEVFIQNLKYVEGVE